MNRRRFLEAACSAAAVSQLAAQLSATDVPDWGGPVLDVHLHAKGPGGEWTHMQGCGVTHAQLLVSPNAEAHVKEEIAKHPGRFHYSGGVDPASDHAIAARRAS